MRVQTNEPSGKSKFQDISNPVWLQAALIRKAPFPRLLIFLFTGNMPDHRRSTVYQLICQRSPQLLSVEFFTVFSFISELFCFSLSKRSNSAVSNGSGIRLFPVHWDKYAAFDIISSFIPSYPGDKSSSP